MVAHRAAATVGVLSLLGLSTCLTKFAPFCSFWYISLIKTNARPIHEHARAPLNAQIYLQFVGDNRLSPIVKQSNWTESDFRIGFLLFENVFMRVEFGLVYHGSISDHEELSSERSES